jgi:hypothetical protein
MCDSELSYFKRDLVDPACDINSIVSSEPVLRITEECQLVNSFEAYSIKSSKKINFKKPLNGKITIQFPNGLNENVGANDRLRLKKCIQVKAELFDDITELMGHFVDNILQDQATISLSNGTVILVKLNPAGQIIGFQKHFEINGLQVLSHWNEGPAIWNKSVTNLFVFSQKVNSKHLTTFDFDRFFMCQLLSQNAAWNCSDVEMSQLDFIDGFPVPKFVQKVLEASFNLDTKSRVKQIDSGNNLKAACDANSINLKSWLHVFQDGNPFLFSNAMVRTESSLPSKWK